MTAQRTVPQAERIHLDLDPQVVLAAYAGHRRRFAASVADLDAGALGAGSRCQGWTVADLLRHGCDVDTRLRSIWAGNRALTGFDPRTTPQEGVTAARSVPDLEIRDRYVASATAMATEVGGSGAERWGVPSLSPAGPVPWWMSVLHGFFDSWIHERDGLLPLGADVPVEADEVRAVLAWELALVGLLGGPVDAVVAGLRITVEGGPVRVRVAPGPGDAASTGVVLAGDPPLVMDALSGRGGVADALSGDATVVQRMGAMAAFFASPV